MFVLFFPFTEVLSERKWGRGCGFHLLLDGCFCLFFSFVGETNAFSGGDRSFVLWVSLAIILSLFALFLRIRLLPPPPPCYLFPMLMPRYENILFLQKDCCKNNFLFKWCDLGLFLQFKFSQSN